ncbi:MAG: thioredoxin domain-containing protein [Candidatus Omnitrophica bacterium]|nr:thioredoxin domain-containing protein [Candidatus Omnitrophota bacterium]
MDQKTIDIIKRIVVIWGCTTLILVLIGLKIREYKRDFLFEKSILRKLSDLEKKQDEILNQLDLRKPDAMRQQPKGFQMPQMPDPNKIYSLDLGASPVKGDLKGKVTLVEFSDFQCPYSKAFHSIFLSAANSYSSGVKFVFKNFPLSFHPQARPAAKALLAAKEQGKYWEMMELLFANADNLSETKFIELAGMLKLDIKRFAKDLKEKDGQWEKLIEADIVSAKKAEVMGTPTFYLNGKRTQARTAEDLKKEINQILKK